MTASIERQVPSAARRRRPVGTPVPSLGIDLDQFLDPAQGVVGVEQVHQGSTPARSPGSWPSMVTAAGLA